MAKKNQIITFIQEIEQKLATIYKDQTLCRQYAWWILEEITRSKKEELIADDVIQLDDQHLTKLNQWLHELVNNHMPIQYLIGMVPFNNIEILLEPPTLIPRPETEEWVIKLIKHLKQLKDQNLSLLDIGTGSGCIALAIAHALPKSTIYATDISEKAIKLAQLNAIHNGITNVHFLKADIYRGIPHGLKFDLIVSNPPYISPIDWDQLDQSVTKWEDKSALVASHEGLFIIENLIKQACCFIKPNDELQEKGLPNVVIEIGYNQGETAQHLMKNADFSAVMVEKDLEGKDRVVLGRTESCGPCLHSINNV